VFAPKSNETSGDAWFIPILLVDATTFNVFVSTARSPVTANEVSVPTLVTLACAAVLNVPASCPLDP